MHRLKNPSKIGNKLNALIDANILIYNDIFCISYLEIGHLKSFLGAIFVESDPMKFDGN